MILVLLLAALLSCDTAMAALFTPARPILGRYEVCTTAEGVDELLSERSPANDEPQYGPQEMLEALDAFGAAGPYDRAALSRLYGGRRVRVVRGWQERPGLFTSVTLLSPYPDVALTRLNPGTMVIRWTVAR